MVYKDVFLELFLTEGILAPVVSHAVRSVHWQRLSYTAAPFITWSCYLRFIQYTTLKGTRPWAKNISNYTRLMIERTTDPQLRSLTFSKFSCEQSVSKFRFFPCVAACRVAVGWNLASSHPLRTDVALCTSGCTPASDLEWL